MFKKIMVSVVSAAVLLSGMQVEAKPFGSRSTATRSTSTSFSRPSAPTSTFTRSAPVSAPTTGTATTGGIARGSAVGMTRSDVGNRVTNGTNVAPGTVSSGSTYANSGTRYGGYAPSAPTYAQPATQGHSTGALLGAAAAGAVGGYMLNGLMHNRDGSVYSGNGYNNGVPVQGYNNGAAPVVMDNGNGNYSAVPMGAAPVVVHNGSSIWWSILGFLLVMLVLYFIWNLFFGSKKNSNEGVGMFNSNKSMGEMQAELEDAKQQMFINFQKNNKPSGLNYIQSNSDAVFFEGVQEDIKDASDTRTITVRSLDAKLAEDIVKEGNQYIGSVVYRGVVIEQEAGQAPVSTNINEMWNFIYTPSGWKIAGIQPV
jgi:hypothetical protein